MRIIVDVQHPAHVHFFKNMIWDLEKKGHEILVTAKYKEITTHLLDTYKFNYKTLGSNQNGMLKKAIGLAAYDLRLLAVSLKFKPDILMGILNESVAHVGFILRKPSITFTDTEGVKLSEKLTIPFTTAVCTPSCFRDDFGEKHVRYNGYHEIAYLHPKRFKPDSSLLDGLGIKNGERFTIVRFISWRAVHDIGLRGIKDEEKIEFVKSLEKFGKVFVTSENEFEGELEKYRINVPVEKMHSLMKYAQMYIGEGGTMAVEAALLGTPAIHIESTSDGRPTGELSGNFLELRDKYKLLYMFADDTKALKKAEEILSDKKSKKNWENRVKSLFKDKVDVTAWMEDFVLGYPEVAK
jgi:predicted glycosyltransferase